MRKVLDKLTARELALEWCRDIDRGKEYGERLYANDEFHACIKTQVKLRKVVEWTEYYYTYIDKISTAGCLYSELMEAVEAIKGHLRVWECYQQEEARLNAILEDLREIDNKDYTEVNGTTARDMFRVSAVEAMRRTLEDMPCTLAKITIDAEGYFHYDCSVLFKCIDNDLVHLYRRYRNAKEFLLGLEEWEAESKSAEFRPSWYNDCIASIRTNKALDVAPMYSRKELHKREQEGERITELERRCAIFPYFEEVECDRAEVEDWKKTFRNHYAERCKETLDKIRK